MPAGGLIHSAVIKHIKVPYECLMNECLILLFKSCINYSVRCILSCIYDSFSRKEATADNIHPWIISLVTRVKIIYVF